MRAVDTALPLGTSWLETGNPRTYNCAMAILVIVEGPQCGRQFPLEAGSAVIGRESSVNICLFVKAVSRRHAQIDCESGSYFVQDLSSNNGTFLNGQRIHERVPLRSGDHLTIGPYVLAMLQEADLVVREQEHADTSN